MMKSVMQRFAKRYLIENVLTIAFFMFIVTGVNARERETLCRSDKSADATTFDVLRAAIAYELPPKYGKDDSQRVLFLHHLKPRQEKIIRQEVKRIGGHWDFGQVPVQEQRPKHYFYLIIKSVHLISATRAELDCTEQEERGWPVYEEMICTLILDKKRKSNTGWSVNEKYSTRHTIE